MGFGVRRCEAEIGDGVTATGRATLNVVPDRLRLRVTITSANPDTRQAVLDLDQRRDAIEQALTDLSPVAGTLSAGATHSNAGPKANQETLEMLLMAPGASAGRTPTTQAAPSVTCTVQAEWNLSAHGSDEAVVNAAALGDRIRAALVHAGQPTTQPATTTAASTMPATEASDTTVEPAFVYVHAVSEAERAKLLATAMERATADARRLADAAGQQVGVVRRLSAASAGRAMSDDSEPIGDYLRMALAEPDSANDQPAEATGSDPGDVSFMVEVTATFVLVVK